MTALILYGASDDLIEAEGLISDEFNPPYDKPAALTVRVDDSAYVVARVEYDEHGEWRIRDVISNAPTTTLRARGEDEPDDEHGCPGYSDKLVIDMGDIEARRVNISVEAV